MGPILRRQLPGRVLAKLLNVPLGKLLDVLELEEGERGVIVVTGILKQLFSM